MQAFIGNAVPHCTKSRLTGQSLFLNLLAEKRYCPQPLSFTGMALPLLLFFIRHRL